MAPLLSVSGLSKSFELSKGERRAGRPRVSALDNITFGVEKGSFVTLLGPSGCGKTTTMRSIAGIETPDAGRIELAGRVLFDAKRRIRVPANRRNFGVVFQSYAIWPHMSVAANIAFPLQSRPRHRRPHPDEVRAAVSRVLERVGLKGIEERPATQLSGGQQQRVALARALVGDPELLLLDEPLSNLDAKLRDSMRLELKRLHRDLGLTVIFVTHDQGEALSLSDRIIVMDSGTIVQRGTPSELYEKPATRFVAELTGSINHLDGRVTAAGPTTYDVDAGVGTLVAAVNGSELAPRDAVTLLFRPEAVGVATDEKGGFNRLDGTVIMRTYLGSSVDHLVGLDGGREIHAILPPEQSVAIGEKIRLSIPAERIALVPWVASSPEVLAAEDPEPSELGASEVGPMTL